MQLVPLWSPQSASTSSSINHAYWCLAPIVRTIDRKTVEREAQEIFIAYADSVRKILDRRISEKSHGK